MLRISNSYNQPNGVQAIDLFCGAGGLTRGLLDAGIDVRVGVDVDKTCAYPYTENNGVRFLNKSVDKLKSDELRSYLDTDKPLLLAGCAPCQTFSAYNGKASENDPKWWLLKEFGRLIQELSPDFVTMENVPRLINKNVYQEFLSYLKNPEYNISSKVIDCSKYGVPQTRSRLVFLASLHGELALQPSNEFGEPARNVRDVIHGLTPIEAGETDQSDELHTAANLDSINMRRIKASKAGGTWQDWPSEILANCHKKPTGAKYLNVYGRMEWEKLAPTLTTNFYGFGTGRFGHPEQNRALSLREGALLQGFPLEYQFIKKGEKVFRKTVGRLIGNAVPVLLGKAIGESVKHHSHSIHLCDARKRSRN